ncbi:hypothetical protein [Streptomyces sp. NRRL S-448]|uniref:hypothetical protein n=1 Tax=Streptomyces sp. NRRL S-448 TaxID=1463907 RepID=UPI0035661DDB
MRSDGLPAALASVRYVRGRARTYTAGVGDLATGAKVPEDGQARVGSTTKTGRLLAEEIDERVVRAVGLRHTYFPTAGDTTVRERHPRSHRQESAGVPWRDVTDIDPSASWAAGQDAGYGLGS